jgi:TPR repeat protein
VAPTREEITTAYQSALQSRAPAAAAPVAVAPVVAPPVAVAPVAAPPARKLDADELATLLNRAKGLLAAGDIPSARLLLERAADAQEPSATLMLARTYDPDVLGTQDARNIIPDPATARAWYQTAAQLGSADAQRRLTQLQN